MPWSGSSFTREHSWTSDAANNIDIEADRHDEEDDNFRLGIETALRKDGGNTVTANLNMGAFRLTNLGTPTATTDATTKAYVDAAVVNASVAFGGLLERTDATTLTLTNESADVHSVPDGSGGWTNLDISTPPTIDNTGLTASTLYYCYLYDDGGAATLELSTTVPVFTSNGDLRLEVKTGATTRVLVGVIRTEGSTPGQFVNSATQLFVRSTYNETPAMLEHRGQTGSISAAGLAEWTAGPTIQWVDVPGRAVSIKGGYTALYISSICHPTTAIYVDGTKETDNQINSTTSTTYGGVVNLYDHVGTAYGVRTARIGKGSTGATGDATVSNGFVSGLVVR